MKADGLVQVGQLKYDFICKKVMVSLSKKVIFLAQNSMNVFCLS